MHLSARWDLYCLPPSPSPVGALRMCPGIWSSLWEKKDKILFAHLRVWIVTTLAVIRTALLSCSLLNSQTSVHSDIPGQRGSDGAFPCPALCQRPWDVSQSSAVAPVPVQGGKLAVSRCLLGRSSGVGVSEGRALQGSALRLQPLLNLHLDILCFQQKETFTLLQCSTPVTFIFCTSWLKQKISDGQGLCCVWMGIAWFDFVLAEVSHCQTEFSPGSAAQQPLPYTTRLCSVTILPFRAHGRLPRAVESSGVLAGESCCPSLRTHGSLCLLCGWHFSSNATVVRPSPTSQGGWHLIPLLRVKDSLGFLWYFISRE